MWCENKEGSWHAGIRKGRRKEGQFTKRLISVQMRGQLVLLRAQRLYFDRTTKPTQLLTILQKKAEISRVMVITQICYFSRFEPMYFLNQWHGSAERLILHSKELLARATKSTVVLVRSNMTFQYNPHFWNYLYQSLPSLNQPRQVYEVTFHEKCYLYLAEVNNFPKVYRRICMPFTID